MEWRGGEGRGVGGKYCDYVDGGASNLHQVRLTVCCHVECSLVWLRAALRSASLDTNSSVSYRRVSLQQWTRGRVDEEGGEDPYVAREMRPRIPLGWWKGSRHKIQAHD